MIREGDHRFALVLEETVLYYRVSDDAAMAAQLDDNQVAVETLTAEINLTTPGEISTYLRAFSELSRSAVRGAEARALIVKALDALG
ncbi:hypothetical protein [Streptomyces sp. NPDC058726]|uniref:hypothetical protein n=1 Tax=Streptomyces sp. NPDC058726 TaxID=3346611 RepID=UPI0036C5B7C6